MTPPAPARREIPARAQSMLSAGKTGIDCHRKISDEKLRSYAKAELVKSVGDFKQHLVRRIPRQRGKADIADGCKHRPDRQCADQRPAYHRIAADRDAGHACNQRTRPSALTDSAPPRRRCGRATRTPPQSRQSHSARKSRHAARPPPPAAARRNPRRSILP